MIFVTVGTDTHRFDRLLKEIDSLIDEKIIKEKVVALTGNSGYTPKNYEYYKFVDYKKYIQFIKESSVVISHGGAGTIITILSHKKPLIVVPRLAKFGEHVNDHQLQIVEEMSKNRQVIPLYKISDLLHTIEKAKKMKIKTVKREKPEIFKIIEEKLKEWEN